MAITTSDTKDESILDLDSDREDEVFSTLFVLI